MKKSLLVTTHVRSCPLDKRVGTSIDNLLIEDL